MRDDFIFETLYTVNIDSQYLRNPKLGLNTFRAPWQRCYNTDLKIFAHLRHNDGIRQFRDRQLEPVCHVSFCLLNSHAAGHLHAGYQISGSPHSAHSRGMRVGESHTKRITHAHLQPVQATDLDHGFGCP